MIYKLIRWQFYTSLSKFIETMDSNDIVCVHKVYGVIII